MCYTPVRLKSKYNQKRDRMEGAMTVPCGKCPKCKERRANDWIFRLEQQSRLHQFTLFVTLTYSPENVPRAENSKRLTLCKRDLQLFMKRLRKNTGRKNIKYYACGEYGDDTWRPHYHLIMFDVGYNEVDKAWNLGLIDFQVVKSGAYSYVTKYICKDKRVPAYVGDDRQREFSLMSKNLGINYVTQSIIDWHVNNEASYIVKEGGFKSAMPRYYREKIFTEEQRDRLAIMASDKYSEQLDKAFKEAGSPTQFYKNQFEAIQQLKNNFNKNKLKKRNKL